MSSLLITNGCLVTLDEENRCLDGASVYVEGRQIVAVGDVDKADCSADREIDAGGRLVMPGLINAHHHLYSTFARGFTPPGPPARNFAQNLERLWWKLDAALDAEDVYFAGCTTVFDHHASPACCDGSLDQLERAFREIGLSGCLCYEVSDRNVAGQGIEENVRYLEKCRDADDDQFTALFGLHALMTLGNATLERCADAAKSLDAGFHVHAAEDAVDVETTNERHGQGIMERFHEFGIPGPKTIFVHGTHLEPREMDLLHSTNSMLVSNPESNMNNGLRVSPLLDFLRHGVTVGLGTDGMSSHLISQARAMYMHQRSDHRDPTVAFTESCDALLHGNREICSRLFQEPRGTLVAGQLADIVVHDYVPFTPLDGANFYGHLLFGLGFSRAHTTVARGKVIVDAGRLPHIDEEAVRAECSERAAAIWKRIH